MSDKRLPHLYRKKPVVIEAMPLAWDSWSEMCEFAGVGKLTDGQPEGCYVTEEGLGVDIPGGSSDRMGLWIPTLEGLMLATEGDYVIRGIHGELYPCKPDIFAASYELA